ncbi:hypothetical protein ACTXT7_017348, partial [Hymenolepis weldensis]
SSRSSFSQTYVAALLKVISKVSDKSRLKAQALLNNTRRPILELRSSRVVTCGKIAQLAPQTNPKGEDLGFASNDLRNLTPG